MPALTLSPVELARLGFSVHDGKLERTTARRSRAAPRPPRAPRPAPNRQHEFVAFRDGDTLGLFLPVPPATKKNSTVCGVKQSPAYRRYRDGVYGHIAGCRGRLGLPLPNLPYTCTVAYAFAHSQPDTVGLHQALADALENAGVLTNDRWIVAWDRCPAPVYDPAWPRVEMLLRPYVPPAEDPALAQLRESAMRARDRHGSGRS